MTDQPASRRRFQFRLRTLMIGVTLLAVVCGPAVWVIRDRQRLIEERDRLIEERDRFMEERDDLIKRATANPLNDALPSIWGDLKRYKSEAEDQRRRADMLEHTLSQQQSGSGRKP